MITGSAALYGRRRIRQSAGPFPAGTDAGIAAGVAGSAGHGPSGLADRLRPPAPLRYHRTNRDRQNRPAPILVGKSPRS